MRSGDAGKAPPLRASSTFMKSLLYMALIGSLLPGTQPESTVVETAAGIVTVTPVKGNSFVVSRAPAEENVIYPLSLSLKPEKRPSWIDARMVVFNGDGYSVNVDRSNGMVTFLSAAGDTLLCEDRPMHFRAAPGSGFYGAGERGHRLRLNGDTLVQWNRPNYGHGEGEKRISQMGISMPYLLSDRGFGLLFNDASRSTISFDGNAASSSAVTYDTENPEAVTYTFIGGGAMPQVTRNFTTVTGRQDLPPLWTLGYITSRYGYHNEKEALGAIDSLKRSGYPVDGIVFDLYWYGTETDMGRLEWNKKQFPDHRAMLDSLKRRGVKTVLIHQPYINKKGAIDNYNLLDSLGLLTADSAGNRVDVQTWVGRAGMFDISNPATQKWLWNRLRDLTAEGVDGWWGDLGEPEVHPLEIVHTNGLEAKDYHNEYGNEWSRMIYEGLRRDFPDKRPMLLMRGGTTGLQQYSVFPWTGDVGRSWAGLQAQIKMMLGAGLSGLGYMSSDIGGFAVNDNLIEPELYVRWMQHGVFSPVLRTHAQYAPEPYRYPQQEKVLKSLVRMRYEWLPYNYTLAYENSADGQPLARPLNYYGTEDNRFDDVRDEYLWGREVLVAPVMEKGARSRKVLFPTMGRRSTLWIDWFNPARSYRGGTERVVPAPIDKFPLFVRAGSFIPQYEGKVENTGDYDPSQITVKYFPSDEASEYKLFDDNHVSPTSLADEAYSITTFRSDGKGKITVSRSGNYPGMHAEQHIRLQIVRGARVTTIPVTLTDKEVTVRY